MKAETSTSHEQAAFYKSENMFLQDTLLQASEWEQGGHSNSWKLHDNETLPKY